MTIDRSGNVNFSTAETMLTTRALGATQISLQTQQIAIEKNLPFVTPSLTLSCRSPRTDRVATGSLCTMSASAYTHTTISNQSSNRRQKQKHEGDTPACMNSLC